MRKYIVFILSVMEDPVQLEAKLGVEHRNNNQRQLQKPETHNIMKAEEESAKQE